MLESKQRECLNSFPLPSGWRLKAVEGQRPVLFTKENMVFSLNFSEKKNLSHGQPLAKAIGFKSQPLCVLDITAGWAQDAFLISRLGCSVIAVESNPFVFCFVQESLNQKKLKPHNLKFILDNSLNYLKNLKESDHPDVIYMDPMFGDKKKSLSRKPLRVLKEIVGTTEDQQTLFDLALRKAKKRIVVKRHHLDSPFQKDKLCSFKGRSVCYDVFKPNKGDLF